MDKSLEILKQRLEKLTLEYNKSVRDNLKNLNSNNSMVICPSRTGKTKIYKRI